MVKSGENGSSGSVAPFLKKCYDMVDDHSTDSLISWNNTDNSFVIWDITQFSLTLLPTYFKHNNFSSFIRQLNIYGFRKIDADRWEFSNDNFVRGQKNLLKNIRRKKHPHIADHQQKTLPPQQDNCNEPSSQEAPKPDLRSEVENLKSNKNSLMQELVKLRQHQESAESKLLLLSDRLQGMEKYQQQMLSFLVMVVQSPGFMVQLIQPPKENNWRIAESGKILDEDKLGDKPVTPADGMIIKYKPPPVAEKSKKRVVPLSPCFDKQPEPVFSTDGFKDWNISSEFLEVLMDEKLLPLENHSPFLLPDLPDDSSWEQLFLSSPFLGSNDDSNPESEEGTTASGMDIEPTTSEIPNDQSRTFESMIVEMEKTQNSELELCADGGLESLESLTEQIELLASEPDHDNE